MARRRTYGFSFSWRRALGVSATNGRVSRSIGIPLTRSGRRQKLGRMVESGAIVVLLGAIFTTAAGFAVGLVNAIVSTVLRLLNRGQHRELTPAELEDLRRRLSRQDSTSA